MQRKFIRNLLLLLLLNLLIKPFWILGIDRTVQNTVGASEYGFYFAIFNFSFLFNILLDFGITNFNNRNIAQNNQLLRKHLSNLLVLKILLFGVYLLVTFAGALIISYSREQIELLVLLAVNQFLISMVLYLRSNLGALHLFRTDSLISVFDKVLMIILCSLLLWGNITQHFKIQYYVYAQTLAYMVTAITTLIIVLHKAGHRLFRLNWNFPFLLIIMRQSFPFAILVLLMTFYNRIDSVMLERLLPQGALYSGFYASAYRLLDAANNLALLFSVLLLPIFSRMIKQGERVEQMIRLSFSLIIVPAILVAVGSFFYSGYIMELLYPLHPGESLTQYTYRIEESSRVFGLLMGCFIAISSTYIFGTLLTANGSMKQLNFIALGGMLFNLGLNLLIIPRYQASGAAMVSLFTQTATAFVQVLVVKKMFRLRISYTFLLRLTVYFAGCVLINIVSLNLSLPASLSFTLMVAACGLLALLSGLLNIKGIWQHFLPAARADQAGIKKMP